jgi:AraC-like DNA-binding protein
MNISSAPPVRCHALPQQKHDAGSLTDFRAIQKRGVSCLSFEPSWLLAVNSVPVIRTLESTDAATPPLSRQINGRAFEYFPALRKVRNHFEANYSEPLSLRKAAGIAGLEEKYFSHLFRRHVGIGFKEWTDKVRIGKAMENIEKEQQPLTTVGFAVGFQSCVTFQRQFKKHARMRPRDFRNSVVRQIDGPQSSAASSAPRKVPHQSLQVMRPIAPRTLI